MASKELIEKVARELCLSYGRDPDVYASLCDICGPNNEPLLQWHIYTEQAETASATILAALQEPTEGMLCAAAWELENPKSHESRDHIKAILAAMLNASPLGEQSE